MFKYIILAGGTVFHRKYQKS